MLLHQASHWQWFEPCSTWTNLLSKINSSLFSRQVVIDLRCVHRSSYDFHTKMELWVGGSRWVFQCPHMTKHKPPKQITQKSKLKMYRIRLALNSVTGERRKNVRRGEVLSSSNAQWTCKISAGKPRIKREIYLKTAPYRYYYQEYSACGKLPHTYFDYHSDLLWSFQSAQFFSGQFALSSSLFHRRALYTLEQTKNE